MNTPTSSNTLPSPTLNVLHAIALDYDNAIKKNDKCLTLIAFQAIVPSDDRDEIASLLIEIVNAGDREITYEDPLGQRYYFLLNRCVAHFNNFSAPHGYTLATLRVKPQIFAVPPIDPETFRRLVVEILEPTIIVHPHFQCKSRVP